MARPPAPSRSLAPAARPRAASSSMLAGGDHQHGRDRHDAEQARQPEHGREAEAPAEQAGQRGPHHVARMVEGLVAAVLPVEAGLAHHAERDAHDGRPDGGARDRGGDLGRGHEPELLRQQDQRRSRDGADARHHHEEALVARCVDERAGRRRHDHAGDAADRHHGADEPAPPAVREQEDAEERADAGLHVGHEEVEAHQGPEAPRPLPHVRPAHARCSRCRAARPSRRPPTSPTAPPVPRRRAPAVEGNGVPAQPPVSSSRTSPVRSADRARP